MMAGKWNFRTHEYEPYKLPEGAASYCEDMDAVIACAECGQKISFALTYTSRRIHTPTGMGYMVCTACSRKEWREEFEAMEAEHGTKNG